MIYSKTKIDFDIESIKNVFCDNGSPLHIMQSRIHKYKFLCPIKSPAYLRLPWIDVSIRFVISLLIYLSRITESEMKLCILIVQTHLFTALSVSMTLTI